MLSTNNLNTPPATSVLPESCFIDLSVAVPISDPGAAGRTPAKRNQLEQDVATLGYACKIFEADLDNLEKELLSQLGSFENL